MLSSNYYLIVDVGSTTTKALVIGKQGNSYRLFHHREAATTVEKPYEDVMVGVKRAISGLEEAMGKKLLDESGRPMIPLLATSSAGGGLQMLVCGLSRNVTAESASRAALGAGAVLLDVISADEQRALLDQLETLRRVKPDMILLAGGFEETQSVSFIVDFCDLLNSANPEPRFGEGYALPVIYAGCSAGVELVRDTLGERFQLHIVPNLRPSFGKENLQPTLNAIHELFLSHVMAQAPGYKGLNSLASEPIMPTPVAVSQMMTRLAERDGIDIVGVDIGGATTDVFSVLSGTFHRTVSANLGMSYSAGNTFVLADKQKLQGWIPFDIDLGRLESLVFDKLIFPTTIPATLEDLFVEQALARTALELAFAHHRTFTRTLPSERSVLQRALASQLSNLSLSQQRENTLDMERVVLIIGSGGVLSHAPRRAQAAAMLLDAFEPKGYTFLAVDSIFMLPHLGALARRNPQAAFEVLEQDCFVPLGPSFSLYGVNAEHQVGQTAVVYELRLGDHFLKGSVNIGEVRCLPLGREEEATMRLTPARGLNIGAGMGKALSMQVRGGEVGVIIDARGRGVMRSVAEARMINREALVAMGAFLQQELPAWTQEEVNGRNQTAVH